MKLSKEPLLSEVEIQNKISELADTINKTFAGESLLVLVVLKGALFFASDLTKKLSQDMQIDFVRCKSYAGMESTGEAEVLYWPTQSLENKHILLIEDILDTGLTCSVILKKVKDFNPAKVSICTLLDKPSRRTHSLEADFCGFRIDDHFVVGYGLDYDEQYRNLPAIYILEE